ncbi:TetR/AcrR family transcriptional regulator [Nocardioides marmoriginsengisoli]|uniref:TetR/AcrR family transcriptional regulator n=1 Tax=Nocardioides marmoriginsengisoli TaxID=661483 RepID=A0A3N0CHF0_9ACTN|nr:TetR/AcrR family transcriptional regulator [Nocardioides marmoriginsengisoli]RNL62709.1 TetR/AcrR family transcriptional regulator [Nocardioides marmoriginsengisoli]
MVRYAKEHKEETRKRILESAGHRFKQDGLDGSGIATLMSDAGLTNGAFYAHFKSKDDLVAAVLVEQQATQVASFDQLSPGHAGIAELIGMYLSPTHRDQPQFGCPSAALLDEVARSSSDTRQAYTSGASAIFDAIALRLAPEDPNSIRTQAASAFAMMIGTIQLSRALTDATLADALLETTATNVLDLLGLDPA